MAIKLQSRGSELGSFGLAETQVIFYCLTGQSNSNRIRSVLHSEEGQLNTQPEIINEMNLYFTKVSHRLIKDKRPFNDRNAVKIMEFVNSRKPENVHFKVPLIKSDELKSILNSLDPARTKIIARLPLYYSQTSTRLLQ